MQLRATAEFPSELVKGWLKIIFAKEHARQFQLIQFVAKLLGIDEWRSENLKWPRCAATFGNICTLEQTHTGIDRRGIERRHVGRGHDPRQARLVKPHGALPAFHW